MVIKSWYNEHLRKNKKQQAMLVGGLVVLLLVGGFYGYQWYIKRFNGRAQHALSRGMELYSNALSQNNPSLWKDASAVFADGYHRYARSSLAPYFLAFGAQVALKQNEEQKAFDLMKQAVEKATDPLKGMYEVKLALMKLDSDVESARQEGEKALHELAEKATGETRDMAAFYGGLLAFDRGDRAKAELFWKPLIEVTGERKKGFWADMAQEKLNYLS